MASTSQKRPATARMHTTSPRKRSRVDNLEPTATALDPTPLGTWLVKANTGECPPYVSYAGWVEDPFNSMLYLIGGVHPGDRDYIPTSNFYSCDTRSMKWVNLTDKLRFRDPSDPYGPVEQRRETQKLPPLSQPGTTLVRIHGASFIFMYGGYSLDDDKAVSTLIAVDVDHQEWWYVHTEGGDVVGRINPLVVAIDQKIYIFGGCAKYYEADPQPFQSYSILSYRSALRQWIWEARDIPYSNLVPPHQFFGDGIPVYNGKKIMLMPGKPLCHDDPLDFTEQKIYYFHTEHRQFQLAPHLGDYPKEVLWYTVHRFPTSPSLRPRLAALPSRKPCGRPSKQGPGPSGNTPPIPSPLSSSVILCAWVPQPNSKYAVPELWRLSLSHNDEIRCLNKRQNIWDLNHDFQGCIAMDNRIILLGNNSPKGEECWNIHLDVVLAPEDKEDQLRTDD